uniref:Transmembrane protein 163b n=1 Tax=Gasterosteus aculeatus aculeatus TaxID=481459 RepID=A0AAQ4RIE6_GASAC
MMFYIIIIVSLLITMIEMHIFPMCKLNLKAASVCTWRVTAPRVFVCRPPGKQHAPEAPRGAELPQESSLGVLGLHSDHDHPGHRRFHCFLHAPQRLSVWVRRKLTVDPPPQPPRFLRPGPTTERNTVPAPPIALLPPLQFDATLDVLSSAIVLWRYSNAAAVHSAHREYIACVILGVVFILSSLCIMGKAIHDLATKLLPEVDDFLFSVSIISGLLCITLAVVKFMLGRVLTSRALITDGFNSLVGGVMGFSILISAEVFKHEPQVWYLDRAIGVLIGLIILAYGVKLLLDMVPRLRQTRNYERFE